MAVYTWAEGTSDADIAEFTGMLERLPARIPEIRGYAFGPDLGLVPGNGDFGLVAELDDEAAFRTYVAHPDHQPVLAWVAAHVAHRSAVQLSI
ncbi:MAG: stress protein [Actinomycetia bacterium]|nr:stress protein [Actinomycetes bacterium]